MTFLFRTFLVRTFLEAPTNSFDPLIRLQCDQPVGRVAPVRTSVLFAKAKLLGLGSRPLSAPTSLSPRHRHLAGVAATDGSS